MISFKPQRCLHCVPIQSQLFEAQTSLASGTVSKYKLADVLMELLILLKLGQGKLAKDFCFLSLYKRTLVSI